MRHRQNSDPASRRQCRDLVAEPSASRRARSSSRAVVGPAPAARIPCLDPFPDVRPSQPLARPPIVPAKVSGSFSASNVPRTSSPERSLRLLRRPFSGSSPVWAGAIFVFRPRRSRRPRSPRRSLDRTVRHAAHPTCVVDRAGEAHRCRYRRFSTRVTQMEEVNPYPRAPSPRLRQAETRSLSAPTPRFASICGRQRPQRSSHATVCEGPRASRRVFRRSIIQHLSLLSARWS